jgi:predicted nucleotidyltransferase
LEKEVWPVPTEQHEEMIQTLLQRFQQDPRVLAIWVGGSIGRGEGTPLSDLDFYIAVPDEVFEDVFHEVPSIIEELYPIEFKTQFLFRKTSPTERDWFLFLKGVPLHLKLDFHVHTLSSIRGGDPDHRKEMYYAKWKVLYNPSGALQRGEPLPEPEVVELWEHVAERIEYFTYVFSYCAQFIRRDDFWNSIVYLSSLRDRVLYLFGIYFEPALIHDSYEKRLRKNIPADILQRLDAPRFGADRESQAQAFLQMLDLFAEVGQMYRERDHIEVPAAFWEQIRAYVVTLLEK